MRSLVLVAFLLAGCPEPPEKPQTAAPTAGQPAAGQPPDGANAGPANAGTPPDGQAPAGQPPVPGGEVAAQPPKPPGGPGGPIPKFEIVQGQTVKVSGTIAHSGYTSGTIVIEVLRNEKDIAEPIRLNVITLDKPGPFEFEAPKDLGAVTILSYVGTPEQGPGPEGAVDYTEVINVAGDPISGIALDLVAGPKSKKSK